MKKKKSLLKKIIDAFLTFMIIIMSLLLVFAFYQKITGDITGVFGYQVYRISSGSMLPVLEVGDVILGKQVEPEEIKVGDILVYHGLEGSLAGKIITHQVIDVEEVQGNYTFIAKGTANNIADPPIDEDQIIGICVQKVPFLTSMFELFMSPWGLVIILVLLLIMFSGELVSLIKLIGRKDSSDILIREEDDT